MDFTMQQTLLLASAACLSLMLYRWYRVRITPFLTLIRIIATGIRLRRLFSRNSERLSCETAAWYWLLGLAKIGPETKQNVLHLRAMMSKFCVFPLDPWATESSEIIEGYDGQPSVQCYVRWYGHSEAKSSKIIIYFHGGGYVIGDAKTHARHAANLSRALGMKVFLPEYRLCPENVFPAPVEDCLSAYMHLIEKCDKSPRDIIFMGESAGATLVTTVMLTLRDRALPLPAAGVMMSPFTNLKFDFDSWTRNAATDKVCNYRLTPFLRDVTMGTCDLPVDDPLLSPQFANLEGLPPLFVQAGTHEILQDCAPLFAEKAIAAGVDCELSLVEGGFHMGEMAAEFSPEGREQFKRVCKFVENVSRNDTVVRLVSKTKMSRM
eukprot:485200_1